jgi:hypothetical protein
MCVSVAVSRASRFVTGVPSRFRQPASPSMRATYSNGSSGVRADGDRGEQQQASVSHVTGDLRWRQLFG